MLLAFYFANSMNFNAEFPFLLIFFLLQDYGHDFIFCILGWKRTKTARSPSEKSTGKRKSRCGSSLCWKCSSKEKWKSQLPKNVWQSRCCSLKSTISSYNERGEFLCFYFLSASQIWVTKETATKISFSAKGRSQTTVYTVNDVPGKDPFPASKGSFQVKIT